MRIVSRARAPSSRPRRGSVTVAWLFFLALLVVILLYALHERLTRSHMRVELQDVDDAAAHAAARTLVTETVFAQGYLSDSSVADVDRKALIKSARDAGERFARLNIVRGQPYSLRANPDNANDGDLYVGTLTAPLVRDFSADQPAGYDPYHPDLNGVRVVTRRGRVAASATYFVDRDVVGFRLRPPLPASVGPNPPFPPRSLPLMPIAIKSRPFHPQVDNDLAHWAGAPADTWENRIMARKGSDQWKLNATSDDSIPASPPSVGGDGIPEITVTLTEGAGSSDNGRLVFFDEAAPFARLVEQVAKGVTYADLPAKNGQRRGQFLLNDGTQPANQALAATGALPAGGAADLVGDASQKTGLRGIVGQRRVWMLYSEVQNPGGNPTVTVVGFVAARVMSVQPAASGQVTVVLQPGVLVTDTAVTNAALRDLGPRSLYNPYIARVRMVE